MTEHRVNAKPTVVENESGTYYSEEFLFKQTRKASQLGAALGILFGFLLCMFARAFL